MFTHALSQATSHQQVAPTHSQRKHRVAKKLGLSTKTANISAAVLAVIVLSGFVAYQNATNIALHVASARAGLHASLPSYKPSGFSINRKIQSSPGEIVVSFRSNSDGRNFTIDQKASDWNSQSLQDNFIASSAQPYQRVDEPNGQTIFLYGDANATWVDGGIWYNIKGSSSLSQTQLLKIAQSF